LLQLYRKQTAVFIYSKLQLDYKQDLLAKTVKKPIFMGNFYIQSNQNASKIKEGVALTSLFSGIAPSRMTPSIIKIHICSDKFNSHFSRTYKKDKVRLTAQ